MNWEFKTGIPEVPRGREETFVILIARRNGDGHLCRVANYLNRYPIDYEGCHCEHEDDHLDGDGCPTTGWFWEGSHPDYDSYYTPVNVEVIGYAALPDPHLAYMILNGVPW